MSEILLARGDYDRRVADAPYIPMWNRFCENNPTLNSTEASMIARPALKKFTEVGTGPIRKTFSEPGVFDSDLFVVSGEDLFRILAEDGSDAFIGTIGGGLGDVSMAATAPIGAEPAHLFFAEGGVLWLYLENGHSAGTLQASGAVANGDTITIGTTYYQWTNASVDAGAPAGTLANPWLVALGASNTEALSNMFSAIDDTGIPGTQYSTALTPHPTVVATGVSTTSLFVHAREAGTGGDAIATTETGANIAWTNGATLTGGGTEQLSQVAMPDDVGAISVAHINSFIIVVPVQSEDLDTVGKFYFIRPGEITVDPIDFATAERSPDKLHQVAVYGDLFWLLGQKTTEPWQVVGGDDPVRRYPGILFDRGSWEGTAAQVKDSLIVIDEDGAVFQIAGGQNRISNPAVEELIRRAIQIAANAE